MPSRSRALARAHRVVALELLRADIEQADARLRQPEHGAGEDVAHHARTAPGSRRRIRHWRRGRASRSRRAGSGTATAIAGRSMPGSVFSTNFAIAISAPVLPADTTPSARPSATASIASRMLDRRPARSAMRRLVVVEHRPRRCDARSRPPRAAAAWPAAARSGPRRRTAGNRAPGARSSAMSAPCSTIAGARSPPIASRAMVTSLTGRAPCPECRARRSPRSRCGTTSRPSYWPQDGHRWCGRFSSPQSGHSA